MQCGPPDPTRPPLQSLIEACSPTISAPAEPDAVNAVRLGLQILYELSADPSGSLNASLRVKNSQQKLTGLAEDLERLRAYKVLHDTLQKVQIDHYGQMKQQLDKMRQEPTVIDEIGAHIEFYATTFARCNDGGESLEGNSLTFQSGEKVDIDFNNGRFRT